MKPAYILTGNTFTGIHKGKFFTIHRGHPKFEQVRAAWQERDFTKLEQLIDGIRLIESFTMGNVKVLNGTLTYKKTPVSGKLAERIFELMEAQADYQPLIRFLDNLMQNPSASARDELFLFLENGHMPITEDGHFLAYRKVNDKFLSYHRNPDGTANSNRPGEVVTMPREECDANRHQTCSKGLHFCSFDYLPSYEGGRGKVVIVSINPRDVTAIPSDYNNAKGRCCRYEVIAEHEHGEKEDSLAGALAIVKTEFAEGQTLMGKARKFVKAIIGKKKK